MYFATYNFVLLRPDGHLPQGRTVFLPLAGEGARRVPGVDRRLKGRPYKIQRPSNKISCPHIY